MRNNGVLVDVLHFLPSLPVRKAFCTEMLYKVYKIRPLVKKCDC